MNREHHAREAPDFCRDLRVRLSRRGLLPLWPAKLETWLTRSEMDELNCFRAPRRRADWLHGRWCAKKLLTDNATCDAGAALRWQILSRQSTRRGCRPQVFNGGAKQHVSLSISHSQSITVAAVTDREDLRIGVDVVDPIHLPNSFAATWFSLEEREQLRSDRWSITAGWAAKEAVFKACNQGESFRPGRLRIVDVNADVCRVQYESKCFAEARVSPMDHALIAVAYVASARLTADALTPLTSSLAWKKT